MIHAEVGFALSVLMLTILGIDCLHFEGIFGIGISVIRILDLVLVSVEIFCEHSL